MVYPYPQQVNLISQLFLRILWGQEPFNGTEHGDLETRNQLIFEAFKLYSGHPVNAYLSKRSKALGRKTPGHLGFLAEDAEDAEKGFGFWP